MPSSPQIDVVQRLYNAKGDMDVLREVIAQDAVWDIAIGFPHGGVYVGYNSIINDFFSFFGLFSEFWAEGQEFFEVDDQVIVLGVYRGVSHTGTAFSTRFAHFYTLRNGQLVRLQQTADTAVIDRVLAQ